MMWTPARISALKGFVGEKRSASETADRMGLTRGMVIGKAFRLGLKFVSQRQPKRTYVRRERIRFMERPAPVPVAQPPEFLGLTIWQVGKDQCRYMHGEGALALYCGQPALDGSWCQYHREVCFHRAMPERRTL